MHPIFKNLKTPEDIFKYLINNIKYDSSSNWTLKSIDELYNAKKGNCHDQAHFIYKALKYIGIKSSLLFFIEYNESENIGGRTHTLTAYNVNGKIYWLETSWGGFEKIHGPFENKTELKKYIAQIHSTEPQSKRYPLLQWGNASRTKEGMNLGEYVNACINIKEYSIFESVEII